MSAKNTKFATEALRKRKRSRKRPVTPTSAFSDVSEFFTLRDHYARLSSDWVTQKFLESKEGEARSQILQSLIEEGKAANLAEADSILKELGF